MNPKILILLSNTEDWFGWSMEDSGLVKVGRLYRKFTTRQKQIFKFNNNLPNFFRNRDFSYWYGDWKNYIEHFDVVIILDSFENTDVIKFIKKICPKIRIIVYYNNPIHNELLLQSVQLENCEIWSFDMDDCQKYGLRYNPQFYFKSLSFHNEKLPNLDYTSDVLFVGRDKGRLPVLINLEKEFQQRGLKTKFIITADKRKRYTADERKHLSSSISYYQCVTYAQNCQFILDIVQDGQNGMTRRVMEAMFFDKKLITNNYSIQNRKFYNKQNICLLGGEQSRESGFFFI